MMGKPTRIANIDAAVLVTIQRLKTSSGGWINHIHEEIRKRAKTLTRSAVNTIKNKERQKAITRLVYHGYLEADVDNTRYRLTEKGKKHHGASVDYNREVPKSSGWADPSGQNVVVQVTSTEIDDPFDSGQSDDNLSESEDELVLDDE